MRYLTEIEVRKVVEGKVSRVLACCPSKGDLAKRIGTNPTQLARSIHGGVIAGKILAWSGYRKTTTKLYEKVK